MKSFFPAVAVLMCLLFTWAPGEEKPVAPAGGNAAAEKVEEEPFTIFHINDSCPVHLVDPYGVMLINTGLNKDPSPSFIIAIKKGRTLIETADPGIAAQALKLIPKGSKVRWYDSCSMPRSYGLAPSVRNNFEAAMKKAGLVLLEEDNITCYCEKPLRPLPVQGK